MNKTVIKFIIASAILIVLLVFGLVSLRLTGVLGYYRVVTPGSSPSLEPGDRLLSLSFLEPQSGNFICYQGQDGFTSISRLCGMEGDEIEMIKGRLYLNGVDFDKDLNTKHAYKTTKAFGESLLAQGKINEKELSGLADSGSLVLFLTKADVDTTHCTRVWDSYYSPHSDMGDGAQLNDFGPVTVPVGKIFVLGDNRDNSYDSRLQGFLPTSSLQSVVIGK